jgi:hypothetical protein
MSRGFFCLLPTAYCLFFRLDLLTQLFLLVLDEPADHLPPKRFA